MKALSSSEGSSRAFLDASTKSPSPCFSHFSIVHLHSITLGSSLAVSSSFLQYCSSSERPLGSPVNLQNSFRPSMAPAREDKEARSCSANEPLFSGAKMRRTDGCGMPASAASALIFAKASSLKEIAEKSSNNPLNASPITLRHADKGTSVSAKSLRSVFASALRAQSDSNASIFKAMAAQSVSSPTYRPGKSRAYSADLSP